MFRTSLLMASALFLVPAAQAQRTCVPTDYGTACGGIRLDVSADPQGAVNKLRQRVSGALPSSFGFFSWGRQPLQAPVPGTGCLILTDHIWGHSFRTNRSGEATLQRAWPASAPGTIYIQFAVFDFSTPTPVLQMTQGVRMECR